MNSYFIKDGAELLGAVYDYKGCNDGYSTLSEELAGIIAMVEKTARYDEYHITKESGCVNYICKLWGDNENIVSALKKYIKSYRFKSDVYHLTNFDFQLLQIVNVYIEAFLGKEFVITKEPSPLEEQSEQLMVLFGINK